MQNRQNFLQNLVKKMSLFIKNSKAREDIKKNFSGISKHFLLEYYKTFSYKQRLF